METAYSKIDDVTHKLEIKCDKSEFDALFNAELIKAQKKIELKGFRKGKAPLSMIKQQVGDSIFHEVCYGFADIEFRKFAETEKPRIADAPSLIDIQTSDEAVTCILEYETHPDLNVSNLNEVVVDEPIYLLEDEDVEEFIDRIRISYGSEEDAEILADKFHKASAVITKINKETNEQLEPPFELEELNLYDPAIATSFRNALLNLKVGDTIEFDAAEIDVARANEILKVEIKSIKKLVLPELEAELISKISNGRFDTVEDLKEDIGLSLQEALNEMSSQLVKRNTINNIIEHFINVPMPNKHINNITYEYVVSLSKSKKVKPEDILVNESEVEKYKKEISTSYLWALIKDTVAQKEGIQVEDEDIQEAFAAMGLPPDLATREFFKQVDKDGRASTELLDKKIVEYLASIVTTNGINVSKEEKMLALANIKLNDKMKAQVEDNIDDDEDDYDFEDDHVHDENCNHDH